MSNKGWPSLKGCKLMSRSHLRPAQESSQICYKNNHKDFSGSCTCPQAHTGYKLTTGASSSKLRHLGAYYWFINILYLHTSDYNRLNYGKDMCNRTCCYLTCNCQPSLSLCRFAFPFLIGGWYKPYLSQGRTKRRRWERQERSWPLLQGQVLPPLRSVLFTV